ncbi:uncharacterized protein DUF3108 [Mangrovibacterium diazotrophicum]|uniref:Uncharacterized protein DUF3108 n=1 Tax=Mangrovibacterium diazotrophicum TaxID=1261403 RepID=A0A419W9G6_9BACT|nr:uncharacterized protein DUF3108 [Mangrovibacterium diazotrophicum]
MVRASLILALAVGSYMPLTAQTQKFVFSPGEEISYGAYYNWHFIWVNAGEIVFKADTLNRGGEKEWLVEATGHTYKAYDLMYTVRDTFYTYLSYPEFEPRYFYRAVNHGSSSSQQYYKFNHPTGQTTYFHDSEDTDPVHTKFAYKKGIHDILSQAYQFRNYDFDKLTKDELVKFDMLADDKVSEFYFRYKGIETVKTRNGRKFKCHKVSVWLMEGEFFPEGEDMYVWFTADDNHIPIMVETKIQIGSVKALFLDAKSLTFPLKSEIN